MRLLSLMVGPLLFLGCARAKLDALPRSSEDGSQVAVRPITEKPTAALAAKRAASGPYVKSYLDGRFYIKGLPGAGVQPGSTTVFRVQTGTDNVVDSYSWFSEDAGAVELAWSPIAGKVAIARLLVSAGSPKLNPLDGGAVSLDGVAFFLGGAKTKAYTAADLARLAGAKLPELTNLRDVLSSRQLPSSNDYVFALQLPGLRELTFDIMTGAVKP